jgi:hypothetical protein
MRFQFKILFVSVAKLLRLGEVSLPPLHSVASVSLAKNMHPPSAELLLLGKLEYKMHKLEYKVHKLWKDVSAVKIQNG